MLQFLYGDSTLGRGTGILNSPPQKEKNNQKNDKRGKFIITKKRKEKQKDRINHHYGDPGRYQSWLDP